MKVLLDENFPLGLDDFLGGSAVNATIVVSRVRQWRPLADRIAVWREAIANLSRMSKPSGVFDLSDRGVLEPWLSEPRR